LKIPLLINTINCPQEKKFANQRFQLIDLSYTLKEAAEYSVKKVKEKLCLC